MAEKEHVKKIKNSNFNRQRCDTGELRDNCTSGFIFTLGGKARKQSAFHHILAVSSLQDGNIQPADKLDFFHNCMAMTTWNINDGTNLIGLPLKSVYANADRYPLVALTVGPAAAATGTFGTIPDLPCHQNEHDDYNRDQVKDLIKTVWKPLQREQKNCSVDGKSIKAELDDAITPWRDFLEERGTDPKPASHCWIHRNDPGYDAFWYKPFSMNPGKPRKVIPPPDLADRTGTIRAWMGALFNTIV